MICILVDDFGRELDIDRRMVGKNGLVYTPRNQFTANPYVYFCPGCIRTWLAYERFPRATSCPACDKFNLELRIVDRWQ